MKITAHESRSCGSCSGAERVRVTRCRAARRLEGRLVLCDLAGPDRAVSGGMADPGAAGARLQRIETQAIARSHQAFNTVVRSLANAARFHIPFSSSTITRLLRDALGGNCITSVVSCCSSCEVCACRHAGRA